MDAEIALETLGQRIREVRSELQMTQWEFAMQLGLKRFEQVSRWERDEMIPPLGRLSEIAALGDMTLAEFFHGVAA